MTKFDYARTLDPKTGEVSRMVLNVEGANILPGTFRNFRGEARTYNNEGKRNFNIVIDDRDLVEALLADGWGVRTMKAYEEGVEPDSILKVNVNYRSEQPPKIMLITQSRQTYLDAEACGELDFAEVIEADLVINGWRYEIGGTEGVSAYLEALYITIREDAFASKYAKQSRGPVEDE